MRNIVLCLSALSIIAISCRRENPVMPHLYEEGELRIQVIHPSAATKVSSTAFESGDRIGLFVTSYDGETAPPLQISGNWANNISTAYDGTSWIPDKKIFWADGKMDVYGYYPYMPLISVDEQPFTIAVDQTTPENGENPGGYEASDLLWAKASGVSSDDNNAQVTLPFKHIMSKLVVKLVKGPDYQGVFPEEGELYIHSLVPAAHVDLARGEAIKDPFGAVQVIRARQVSADTFEAIIVPQRLATRLPFLEYIANGVSFLFEDSFNFRTGVQYTLNLTINANPDQIAIEIGGETTW